MSELLLLRPRELAVWVAVVLLGCLWGAAPHFSVPQSSRMAAAIQEDCATAWRLDVNTAAPEELEMLPGIGPRRARLIVEAREKQSAFASVAELTGIRGFNAALVRRLEPLLQARATGGRGLEPQMNADERR